MTRVELAHWHGGHAPGDVVDVDDVQLAALRKDGRVARIVEDQPSVSQAAVPASAEPLAEEPAEASGRRKARV